MRLMVYPALRAFYVEPTFEITFKTRKKEIENAKLEQRCFLDVETTLSYIAMIGQSPAND